MDCRVKPDNDAWETVLATHPRPSFANHHAKVPRDEAIRSEPLKPVSGRSTKEVLLGSLPASDQKKEAERR
jgi:hypothetical protein